MSGGNFGEVLHEVPDAVSSDDALGHAVGPPALLVEFRELDAFGKPDG